MKQYLTREFLSTLFEKTKKSAALVFALATTFFAFVSFDDLLTKWGHNTIPVKILFLLLLCFISLVIGFLSIVLTKDRPFVIFQKELTRIQVEFGDMNHYVSDNTNGQEYTVVIPINTHLASVAEEAFAKSDSMHGMWLRQMIKCGWSGDAIKKEILHQIQPGKNEVCKIGDSCYFRNVKNVNYLLVATCEMKGRTPDCSKMQYYAGLQSMVDTLMNKCEIHEKIYIPVIGAGYAHVGTNDELLPQMVQILVFHTRNLQRKIHIVVYDKLKKDIQLFALKPSK